MFLLQTPTNQKAIKIFTNAVFMLLMIEISLRVNMGILVILAIFKHLIA